MTAVPMTGPNADHLPASPAIADGAKLVLWTLFFLATSTAFRSFGVLPVQAAWWIADLSALALFLRYQSQFINLALGNLVFMSWPLIACVSALWSIAPLLSLLQGLQLLMTILVAFLVCVQLRLERLILVIFLAMLLAAVATLFAQVAGGGVPGAWRGYFPHKNVMGAAMAILIVTSLCLFLAGRWRAISLAATALGFYLLVKSQSAASAMTLAVALAVLPFAYVHLQSRTTSMIMIGAALLGAAIGAATLYVLIITVGADPIGFALDAVGKDRTLTGRTLLWDLAEDSIRSHPLLGVGFKAYWTNIPAEMLDLLMTVGGVFHFHNNYLDAAVAFGLLGPVLLALGVLVGLRRTVRGAVTGRDTIDVWPLMMVLLTTILTFVENPLMWNHNIWQVFFVAAAVVRR